MKVDKRAGLIEKITRSSSIREGESVLVLLSGGPDSICLLHLLKEGLGLARVGAMHVNYGLRAEAGDDEKHCRDFCASLDVPIYVERVQLPARGNLQNEARLARYDLAGRLAKKLGYDLVATGHTTSDQVETVIYRLAASPGRRALLGMKQREGVVVRPLLALSRQDVIAYCQENNLPFCVDKTNTELNFARNRIRNRVLPELAKVHPAVEQNVLATRDQLEEEGEVVGREVKRAIELTGAGGMPPSVEAARLRELPAALQRLVIRELAERAAPAPVAITRPRVDEILVLSQKPGSVSIDLGPVRVVSEYGFLRFVEPGFEEIGGLGPQELSVPGSCYFGEWLVKCELLEDVPESFEKGNERAILDAGRIGEGIVVRSWREGDRVKPLGLGGSRLLQDVFTDQKVPRSLRRRLPVVESKGEIAWVAGVVTSDAFKVTGESERAVKVTAHRRSS